MTARTLLYLLQPGLEDEEKALLEAERIDALGHSELEVGDRSRSTSEIGSTSLQGTPAPLGSGSMGQWAAGMGASAAQSSGRGPVKRVPSLLRKHAAPGHQAQGPTLVSQERELIKVPFRMLHDFSLHYDSFFHSQKLLMRMLNSSGCASQGVELISRSLASLSRKPRAKSMHNMAALMEGAEESSKHQLGPEVEVLVQHGITEQEAKERIVRNFP